MCRKKKGDVSKYTKEAGSKLSEELKTSSDSYVKESE